MLHPSYNYFTTERICAPLCQQVQLIGVEVFPSSTVEDEASRQEAQEEIEEHELDQREPSCLKYSIAIKQ